MRNGQLVNPDQQLK